MRTLESLLSGSYKIIQDTELYRFTSDAVLLSRFQRAKKGERVADFCAGSGIVGLHFYAENEGVLSVTLFEMQKELAEMSGESIALNGLYAVFTVENVRVQDIPKKYTEYFSLILCNPPYEKGGIARFSLVHRADRLAEVLYTLHAYGLEPKKMQLIAGKTGDTPYGVLIMAVKGGKAGVEVLPTICNDQRGIS